MAKSPEAHRRKLIYLWGCIAVAAIIAVVVGTWATSRHQPPKGTMTVGDAVAGGVVQEEAPAQVNGAVGGDASSEANRVMSLAKALGIPLESVPRDITQNKSGKSDVRQYLERELKSAVASGELDEDDEKAIIGAFEKGDCHPCQRWHRGRKRPSELGQCHGHWNACEWSPRSFRKPAD